jgi:hypothetical protein
MSLFAKSDGCPDFLLWLSADFLLRLDMGVLTFCPDFLCRG